MKNYAEIDDITNEVFNSREKVFELITEYERERIESEEVEELRDEISDLKKELKDCKKLFENIIEYMPEEEKKNPHNYSDIADQIRQIDYLTEE